MNLDIGRRDWMKITGLAVGAFAPGSLLSEEKPSETMEIKKQVKNDTVKEIVFEQKIPIRYNVDLFIAGGGPAGVAAAYAARAQGASVFLAEGHTCLGGMGTAGRIPVFMQVSDGVNFLCGGFGKLVLERLQKERSLKGATDIEALKRTYDELLTSVDTNFTFYTQLTAVHVTDRHIDYVVCASPSSNFAVCAKNYIDATGNGDLATWAGAKFQKGDLKGNMMPGSLCSLWGGIDHKTWKKNRPTRPQPDGFRLQEAFEAGVFTIKDEHLTGMHALGDSFASGNIGHVFDVDGCDERSMTKALIWGRKSMKEYARYYREYIKGFENVQLLDTGSLLGIRETRRIMGDYVLSIDDYMNRAVFNDEIGRYAYPIDIHPMKTGANTYEKHRKEFDKKYRYKKGESYGIPYRTLTPKGFDNLLVAGRCISSDHLVHGSVRVMPGCFITGQAAGMAATLAARQNKSVHEIDIAELQKKLKEFGAFLPNFKG